MTEEAYSSAEATAPGARMTFGEHLDELRLRLFRALFVVAVLFVGGWALAQKQLIWLFMQPHRRAVANLAEQNPPMVVDPNLTVLNPLEDLFFTLKASLLVAMLIGLPFIVYQIWAFIAAGLHENERKAVRRFMPWSMLLSVAGLAFCYMVFFPLVLQFLYARLDTEFFTSGYRLKDYFGLYLMFTFALVLVFQLPVLLSGLGAAGVVDADFLRKYRRHFILIAFIIGGMLTPPEPMSQFLMAVPTIVLYEVGVLLVAMRGDKNLGRKSSEETFQS
ncbi:MAG: twin-arginine translocase subunit TatC [Planctomycetes bacterium]|nr:twin-arginine translocase subunit TatC [Planctomycetota bacterium]